MIQPQAVSLFTMKAFLGLGRTRKLREEVEASWTSFVDHALAPEFALIADALARMEHYEVTEGDGSCHAVAIAFEELNNEESDDGLVRARHQGNVWAEIMGAAAQLPTAYQAHLLCHGIQPSGYHQVAA